MQFVKLGQHLLKINDRESFVLVLKAPTEALGVIKGVFLDKTNFPSVRGVEHCFMHKADVRQQYKNNRIKDTELVVG